MTDTHTSERVETETVETAPAVAEPVPFWNRPYVERYLVPLVLPIAVVVGLVAYVINISRIFLSGHGHIPVMIGSAITVMILLGATLLSAASPRLRQSAITLVSAGFILLIMSSGWLVLGHAQPEKTGPTSLPATLKTTQTIPVTAAPGGKLAFSPAVLTAKTGLAKIQVSVGAAGHNFSMHDATTLFAPLNLAGTQDSGVAFFAKAGTYTFFCDVPGHEAAGMRGSITVTGPPMTLVQALTAAKNPPTAAG
ncbi:MAG TPA: plastocyanin/azurin family copper-binding protein [Acidimicrobiia bacterium]|nr:plastocyanin/azurin family copper-binding protein [Acidimicrobiia bacterium]